MRLPYAVVKRALDVVVALLLSVATAPVMAVAALMVRREDGGPILYAAERVGIRGKKFKMLKFRTMVVDADRLGGSSTSATDPRITRTGEKLRAYKVDELPQLFNVLRGHMSLVGPRPQVGWDVDRYTATERHLLDVRPGITDWASIEFANEAQILAAEDDPDEAYDRLIRPRKIQLGLAYVEAVSFRTDVSILVSTLRAITKN